MTGRSAETGGPRRLGHVLDGFRIAAAARSMARRNHCFLAVCRVEASGPPIFFPEVTLASFPGPCGAWRRQRQSVTFKLNQLSLACPVRRAQPPWTVDDKALMP
jgi:hypothetical protein